jgi:hypothetical protein
VNPGLRLRRVATALAVATLVGGWTSTDATASAAGASDCIVEDATVTWGFKESFRSYISGAIANGNWTVSGGAEYETPDFLFVGGTGELDRATRTGSIQFPGAITFTGHGGILNTTVENPVIEFDGDDAVLRFDVNGTTQDGTDVDASSVEFVSLDIAEAESAASTNDSLTFNSIPATLTDAGAAAFGTYLAGEPFDPVALDVAFEEECAAPAAGPNWWLLGGVAAVVVAGLGFVWFRRPRNEDAPQ